MFMAASVNDDTAANGASGHHHGEDWPLVSDATDNSISSPSSSIYSRKSVNCDAVLSQMESMSFMEHLCRPNGSHHGVPNPQQLGRRDSASLCSAKTSASSGTVPVRTNFCRSVSQDHGYNNCNTTTMAAPPSVQRASISNSCKYNVLVLPFQEVSPSSSGSPSQYHQNLSQSGDK